MRLRHWKFIFEQAGNADTAVARVNHHVAERALQAAWEASKMASQSAQGSVGGSQEPLALEDLTPKRPLPAIKGAVLDLDGTLIDAEPLYFESYKFAAES